MYPLGGWGVEVLTVCGPSPNFGEVEMELDVDNVWGVEELAAFVEEEMGHLIALKEKKAKLYLLGGLNTGLGNCAMPAQYEGIEKYKDNRRDDVTLFHCMVKCRGIKVRE